MSELYDRLNEKTGGKLDAAVDKAAEIGAKTVEYAGELVKECKSKANELKLKGQLRNAFAQLGEKYYEQAVNGGEFEKDELVDKITSIKQTLSELSEKQ